jgi:hypothetical protein
MQISQLDPTQADRFGSTHALHYPLGDGRQIVQLSGVVSVDLQSPGWVNENATTAFFFDELTLDLALPAGLLNEGQSFNIDEAVPYLSINAVSGFSNVGWGVNSFGVANHQVASKSVQLQAQLSVSRSGEILQRVAYHLTLIGRQS